MGQTVGVPDGNPNNFFDTQSVGNQLGHLQAGQFGNINSTLGRWIGIGQPSGVSTELYGMRIQDQGYKAIFSINDRDDGVDGPNQGTKAVELQWGGPNFSFPLLNFKAIGPGQNFVAETAMSLNPNGLLRIAPENTDSSELNLVVQGQAFFSGGMFQSSDRRLKKDIVPLSEVLDGDTVSLATKKLLKLEAMEYKFKAATDNRKHMGFIAQDFEQVFPELVIDDGNGTLAMNYTGLIPALVVCAKEQQEVIDAQADAIGKLTKRLDKLENQLLAGKVQLEKKLLAGSK